MGGRHVQSPQIQPTGESRYRHVRVRRRDARWRRRGSVINADLNGRQRIMLFLLAIMLSFAVYVLLKQRSQRQRPTPNGR